MDENGGPIKVLPGLLPSSLHEANKFSQDWSYNGLIGYGCHSKVMIIDPTTAQIIKIITHAHQPVTSLKWAPKPIRCSSSILSPAVIVYGDDSGEIFVYDVSSSSLISHMNDKTHSINTINWAKLSTAKDYSLITLSGHHHIILWDYITGAMFWKHNSIDEIFSLSLNPNDNSKLIVYNNDWFQEWQGLSLDKFSCLVTDKIYAEISYENGKPITNLSTKTYNVTTLNVIREKVVTATYSLTIRNFIILTTSNHVFIVDMKYYVILCCIKTDGRVNQVIPYPSCDSMLTITDKGIVSMYVGKKIINNLNDTNQDDDIINENDNDNLKTNDRNIDYLNSSITFQKMEGLSVKIAHYKLCLVFSSNNLRLSSQKSCYGVTLNPINGIDIAQFCNDGTIFFQTLRKRTQATLCLSNEKVNDEFVNINTILPTNHNLRDRINSKEFDFGLLVDKMYVPLQPEPTCLCVCPILKYRSKNIFMPVCAVGFKNGTIQLVDLIHYNVIKTIITSTYCVRKIVWVTMETVIILAKEINGTFHNTNLRVVNVNSGHVTHIPITVSDPKAILSTFKVSNMRKYMCIVFKNHPSQFWSLDPLHFLHNVPITSTDFITACEWSSGIVQQSSKQEMLIHNNPHIDDISHNPNDNIIIREHLFCSDSRGTIRHFMMDKDIPTEQSNMSLDSSVSNVVSMAWKVDYLIIGDIIGNITIWSFKLKQSKTYSMKTNGTIQKLLFAPGKGCYQFVALFLECFQLWDASSETLIQTFRFSRQNHPVDIGWLSQEFLVSLNIEGILTTFSINSLTPLDNITERQFLLQPLLPSLLSPQIRNILKIMIIWSPWLHHENFQLTDALISTKLDEGNIPTLQRMITTIRERYSIIDKDIPVVTKALYISILMGDNTEIAFWTLVSYCISMYWQYDPNNIKQKILLTSINDGKGLDVMFDRYVIPEIYKKFKLWYTLLLSRILPTNNYSAKRECVISLVSLNQRDEAIHSLLSTNSNDPNYYADHLRAFAISTLASNSSNRESQILRLIASSLISKDKILEGVELLCFANKSMEAIQYLLSHGLAEDSFWLAKTLLNNKQYADFIDKSIVHSSDCDKNNDNLLKDLTVPLTLSTGNFNKAISLLYSHGQHVKAYHLIQACQEFGILDINSVENFNEINNHYQSWLKNMYINQDFVCPT